MPRVYTATNVFEATVERLTGLYAEGHRVVHSFSGGKDFLAVLECGIIAARKTNRLPVEVVMRDEELGWPGHYEYCERTANRPEVDFTWIVAGQPHSYAFDREVPFWWAFDDRVDPGLWVRRYPPFAIRIPEITITAINTTDRFPPPPGKSTIATIGIRATESRNRMLGVFSMGGWISGANKRTGTVGAWPIYDWKEKDVWHAISEFGWDYPKAYSDLSRAGIRGSQNRMGAFLNRFAVPMLPTAARIWPEFFERLYARFPRLRIGVKLGERLTRPQKRPDETWETCFWRECVETAPAWIADRATRVVEQTKVRHLRHANAQGFPDFISDRDCFKCGSGRGSWRALAEGLFLGDAFSEFSASGLSYMEPWQFRPELKGTPAGTWGGHPG